MSWALSVAFDRTSKDGTEKDKPTMKDLQKMTISIERRQEYRGEKIAYTDLRVWLRMEAPKDSPGLGWISFLMIGDEALDLLAQRGPSVLVDGYHLLKCVGELWVFSNDDRLFRGDESGEALIPYRRVTIPAPVQKFLLDDLKAWIARYDAQGDKREEIVLDYSDRLQEWSEEYGQFKGELVVDGPLDEIKALKGEETFDRSWESISRLALSTTHSKTDKGRINIFRESERSFLWSAGSMNGGLINHGTEEVPDWCVHT